MVAGSPGSPWMDLQTADGGGSKLNGELAVQVLAGDVLLVRCAGHNVAARAMPAVAMVAVASEPLPCRHLYSSYTSLCVSG